MNQIRISASAVIDARPADVFAVIADYRSGHPAILPKENIYNLKVEAGGYGAGTIISFNAKVLGVEQFFRQIVSEPERGRVLVENDTQVNTTTTFTVDSADNGRKAAVTITTLMDANEGIQGFAERLVLPAVMKRIYEKELRQLAAYLQESEAACANQMAGISA